MPLSTLQFRPELQGPSPSVSGQDALQGGGWEGPQGQSRASSSLERSGAIRREPTSAGQAWPQRLPTQSRTSVVACRGTGSQVSFS